HDVARAVVDELGDGAGADRAHVVRLIAEPVEHGLALAEDRLVTANPDGELPALRAARTAAHGRIQHVHATSPEDAFDPPHDGGRVRAEVEVDLAGAHARENALVSERTGLAL